MDIDWEGTWKNFQDPGNGLHVELGCSRVGAHKRKIYLAVHLRWVFFIYFIVCLLNLNKKVKSFCQCMPSLAPQHHHHHTGADGQPRVVWKRCNKAVIWVAAELTPGAPASSSPHSFLSWVQGCTSRPALRVQGELSLEQQWPSSNWGWTWSLSLCM